MLNANRLAIQLLSLFESHLCTDIKADKQAQTSAGPRALSRHRSLQPNGPQGLLGTHTWHWACFPTLHDTSRARQAQNQRNGKLPTPESLSRVYPEYIYIYIYTRLGLEDIHCQLTTDFQQHLLMATGSIHNFTNAIMKLGSDPHPP